MNVIFNKIKRKIKFNSHKLSEAYRIRPNSYPFLSGDMFRAISDFNIESDSDLKRLIYILETVPYSCDNIQVIFVSVSFIEKINNQNAFVSVVKENTNFFHNIFLLVHNGDKTPVAFLQSISINFKHVFAVNVTNETEMLSALPIGLQNCHYDSCGQINDIKMKLVLGQCDVDYKNTLVFTAFNIQNNSVVRQAVMNKVKASRHKAFNKFIPPNEYLNCLSNSLFCISPPGNGLDCHRTWEAIYLKTIPVVHRESLSCSLADALPILVVDDYADFFELSDHQLHCIYKDTIKRNCDMAFAPYWIKLLDKL